MKSAEKARNNGLYRHIRTSKEIIRNLLNDYRNSKKGQHCVQCGYSLEAKAGKYGVYVQCCGAQRHKYKLDEI